MERYRTTVRQIAVYVDHGFYRMVEREAQARRRKVGPTVLEILQEYFDKSPQGETHVRKTKHR